MASFQSPEGGRLIEVRLNYFYDNRWSEHVTIIALSTQDKQEYIAITILVQFKQMF